jgi:hypothetical protein
MIFNDVRRRCLRLGSECCRATRASSRAGGTARTALTQIMSSLSNDPTQASTRMPRCRSRFRKVASTRKPAFSATRREARFPTSHLHSMMSRPRSAKAQRQTARTAVLVTPRPRAAGSAQYPISPAPSLSHHRPTRASRLPVAVSATRNSARFPNSHPAIASSSTNQAACSRRYGDGTSTKCCTAGSNDTSSTHGISARSNGRRVSHSASITTRSTTPVCTTVPSYSP